MYVTGKLCIQAFRKMPAIFRHFAKCLITQFACNIYMLNADLYNSSEIFDEGPTLRKYVNKVQKLNRTTGMFKKGRDEQIMHLENICHRACKKLKINPRSRFLRQLGQREIVMKNECLSWKELNAVISVMVVSERIL